MSTNQSTVSQAQRGIIWTGRVISVLMVMVFIASASMKLFGGEEVATEMAKQGVPVKAVFAIACVELICVLLYAIPWTSMLGAILLTGYMGGAIFVHLSSGEMFIPQIIIPMLVWLGLFLREERLWSILPWRHPAEQ
jgi:uncharacterized membrane protein YphA (DoxX/SURF4 family)